MVTYEEGGDTVVAGVVNGTFDGNNATVTLGAGFGFPEQYTAHLLPASEASGNYTPGETLSSNTSSSVVVSQTARVTTVTGAPNVPVVNAPAKDTTGDGLLDDVRGDGDLDIFDVQTLFNKMDDPVIETNAEFFPPTRVDAGFHLRYPGAVQHLPEQLNCSGAWALVSAVTRSGCLVVCVTSSASRTM